MSDPYTLECDDFKVAAVATMILGQGRYGLIPQDENALGMPVTCFGGGPEWRTEVFGGDEEVRKFQSLHLHEIADCLESVVIGSIEDRIQYFNELSQIPDSMKQEEFKEAWFEQHRTSMNNIGATAKVMAQTLRPFRLEVIKSDSDSDLRIEKMTDNQIVLLLYLETCFVDKAGRVMVSLMNPDEFAQAKKWNDEGLIGFGRIVAKDCTEDGGSHWVTFTDKAWEIAHAARRAKAERTQKTKNYMTTKEKQEQES